MQPNSINWQRALFIPLTILAWLAVGVIGLWLASHVAKTILTLILSAIVAYALTPLVSFLSRWIPRGFAIALAYILGFGVIFGLGALLVVTAAAQVTNLVHNIPHYAHYSQTLEPQVVRWLGPFGVTSTKFHNAETQAIATLQNFGTSTARDSLTIISGIVGTVVDIVLVLILSIYLTSNGPRIAAWMRRETPGSQRAQTTLLIAFVNQVVGGYIRGTLTMATLVGALVGGGMLVLRVPYAVLLGGVAFFMEFVPVVGGSFKDNFTISNSNPTPTPSPSPSPSASPSASPSPSPSPSNSMKSSPQRMSSHRRRASERVGYFQVSYSR